MRFTEDNSSVSGISRLYGIGFIDKVISNTRKSNIEEAVLEKFNSCCNKGKVVYDKNKKSKKKAKYSINLDTSSFEEDEWLNCQLPFGVSVTTKSTSKMQKLVRLRYNVDSRSKIDEGYLTRFLVHKFLQSKNKRSIDVGCEFESVKTAYENGYDLIATGINRYDAIGFTNSEIPETIQQVSERSSAGQVKLEIFHRTMLTIPCDTVIYAGGAPGSSLYEYFKMNKTKKLIIYDPRDCADRLLKLSNVIHNKGIMNNVVIPEGDFVFISDIRSDLQEVRKDNLLQIKWMRQCIKSLRCRGILVKFKFDKEQDKYIFPNGSRCIFQVLNAGHSRETRIFWTPHSMDKSLILNRDEYNRRVDDWNILRQDNKVFMWQIKCITMLNYVVVNALSIDFTNFHKKFYSTYTVVALYCLSNTINARKAVLDKLRFSNWIINFPYREKDEFEDVINNRTYKDYGYKELTRQLVIGNRLNVNVHDFMAILGIYNNVTSNEFKWFTSVPNEYISNDLPDKSILDPTHNIKHTGNKIRMILDLDNYGMQYERMRALQGVCKLAGLPFQVINYMEGECLIDNNEINISGHLINALTVYFFGNDVYDFSNFFKGIALNLMTDNPWHSRLDYIAALYTFIVFYPNISKTNILFLKELLLQFKRNYMILNAGIYKRINDT